MPVLSVVMPAYNEASNISGALDDVLSHVATVVPDLEIIVVDDGSVDGTGDLAREYAARDPRIVVVSQRNQGHGPALASGLDRARGAWLFLLDSDRQVSLSSFAEHWGMTGTYDVVLGLRRPRHDPIHRQAISVMMRLVLQVHLGTNVNDGGAPYKLMRSGVWRDARIFMRDACWIPSVLLAAAALQRTDLKVIEIPVQHRARPHGPSTLNFKRLGRFCREGVADIVHFKNQRLQAAAVPARND